MSNEVADVVAAYVGVYRRRLAQRPTAFDAPLQCALLGLLHLELGLRGGSLDALLGHLDRIAAATRPLLLTEGAESPAVEAAGYTWATAYGRLPLFEPPLPQIEIVISHGRSRRYAGITANAWRALFIASAWPYLSYDLRPQAERELSSRVAYLGERAEALRELPAPQVWQVVGVLAELSHLVARGDLASTAASALGTGLPKLEEVPSSQLAQFAAAARAVGDHERAHAVVDYLLDARHDASTALVAADASGGKPELSPWVPLGLVSATSERLAQRGLADAAASSAEAVSPRPS